MHILTVRCISITMIWKRPNMGYQVKILDRQYCLPWKIQPPTRQSPSDHPRLLNPSVSSKDIDRFFSVVKDVNQDSFGKVEYSPTEIILLVKGGNLFQLQSAQSTNSSFLEFTEVSRIGLSLCSRQMQILSIIKEMEFQFGQFHHSLH